MEGELSFLNPVPGRMAWGPCEPWEHGLAVVGKL